MNRLKGIILVSVSAIVYGLMPLMSKIAYSAGSNPIELTFLRFFLGAVMLFAINKLIVKENFKMTKNQHAKVIAVSFWYAITPILLFISY